MLLDECVPRTLRRELPGHEVKTVAEMGWSGTKNSALLRLAAAEFDVFLTVDQGLTVSTGSGTEEMGCKRPQRSGY